VLLVLSEPIFADGNAEANLEDEVKDYLHPLEIALVVGNNGANKLCQPSVSVLSEDGRFLICEHVFEEDQEGSDLVVVVLTKTALDSLEEPLRQHRVMVRIVHVSLGDSDDRARFDRSEEELLDEFGGRQEQNMVVLGEEEARVLEGVRRSDSLSLFAFGHDLCVQGPREVANSFEQVEVLRVFTLHLLQSLSLFQQCKSILLRVGVFRSWQTNVRLLFQLERQLLFIDKVLVVRRRLPVEEVQHALQGVSLHQEEASFGTERGESCNELQELGLVFREVLNLREKGEEGKNHGADCGLPGGFHSVLAVLPVLVQVALVRRVYF